MATARQVELFRKLTEDRDFSGHDINQLRDQFSNLTDRNASAWIEKALERPKVTEPDSQPNVPAPF